MVAVSVSLTFKMLYDATETVAMGSNQHPLSVFDLWNDLVVPEGQRSRNGVLQTLTGWKLIVCQVSITPILIQMRKLMLTMLWLWEITVM